MPIVIVPSGAGDVVTPRLVTSYQNPAAPTLGYIYVSVGERWDSIAFKMYGDSTLIQPLIANNPGIPIDDYVAAGSQVFAPLITLNVPAQSSGSATPWS